jgi:N-acetylmuramoyl-L-alanine amidase
VFRAHPHARSSLLSILAAVLTLSAPAPHAQDDRRPDPNLLKAQIERALETAPRNFERLLAPGPAGVRVLSVDVRETSSAAETVAVDLSQRALTYEPSGNIEPLLDAIIESTASTVGAKPLVEYKFTIDGLPVDQFLPRASRASTRALPLAAGGVVLVSPGHGLYWDEALASWHLQRPRVRGIVEDLVNWDIARYLRDELLTGNVNAQMARYPEQDDGAGPSGAPRWQEAAKYFIQTLGVPIDVWNFGVDDYARDINARPFYANWMDATALISVHNNGGGETGTETWYDETNGVQEESARLAQIVNTHVVTAIRQRYNPNWIDRGLRTCNGCKGENRLASHPAVIIEIAYMDTPTPDNDALHDDAFKRIVAEAIADAVREWASAEGDDRR